MPQGEIQWKLERSDGFKEDYRLKTSDVQSELNEALRLMNKSGPIHPSLNSHKVFDARGRLFKEDGKQIWESYVTGRHRITWKYKADRVIFLRSTNGHEILPRLGGRNV